MSAPPLPVQVESLKALARRSSIRIVSWLDGTASYDEGGAVPRRALSWWSALGIEHDAVRHQSILAAGALSLAGALGTASCVQSPESTPQIDDTDVHAPAADTSDGSGGSLGEAQEPQIVQMGLLATCLLAAHVANHFLCEDGYYFTNVCPAGQYRVIRDTWDKTKVVFVSCDTLKLLACGTSEIGAAEAMAKFCHL